MASRLKQLISRLVSNIPALGPHLRTCHTHRIRFGVPVALPAAARPGEFARIHLNQTRSPESAAHIDAIHPRHHERHGPTTLGYRHYPFGRSAAERAKQRKILGVSNQSLRRGRSKTRKDFDWPEDKATKALVLKARMHWRLHRDGKRIVLSHGNVTLIRLCTEQNMSVKTNT